MHFVPPSPHPLPESARDSVRAAGTPHVRVEIISGERLSGARSLPEAPTAESGLRDIMVCAPVEGTLLLTPASPVLLDADSLLLIDSERPVTVTEASRCELVVLRVPRYQLPCSEELLARTSGRVYPTTTGTAALLGPLLTTMSTVVDPYGECVAERLRNQLADLVGILVAEATERAPRNSDRELTDGIRRWVNAQLGDARLCPETIAAAHYVSVRRLHKLFEGENGTVSRWIQQRRLEECRRELGRGDGRPVKVSSVAQRWGFANAAHFSRAFRSRYGMSPRDWRQMRTPGENLPASAMASESTPAASPTSLGCDP
ncbi:helix-turn-helix domain-containing protein [Streptomyces sp. NPDC091271]|uniref:helix-turn-helix domain-containing protein n=1 Tax=Streptomyces sp. NPDC091271 TaxID=3365980 RepID=UPI00380C6207